MKNIIRKSILALLLLAFWGCALEQGEDIKPADLLFIQDSSSSLAKHSRYQNLLKKYQSQGLPSLNLLVYDYQKGLWIGNTGFARLEDRSLMRNSNAVPLAQISCWFTAIGVMQLVERRLIELSSPISAYLEDKYLKNIPNADQITVRHLLNHTSGIRDYTQERNFILDISNNHKEDSHPEFFLDYLKGKKAAFDLGKKCEFSATNYLLLGLIVESVTGASFADFIDTYLIANFGLRFCFYKNQENYPNPLGRVNMYLDRLNDKKLENFSKVIAQQTSAMIGHEGIYCTTYDLFGLMQKLFRLEVLQLASLQEMAKTDFEQAQSYGAGFEILDTPQGKAFGYRGEGYGSTTYCFNFQQKGVIIIFSTNVGTKTATWTRQAVDDFWAEVQSIAFE